VKRRGPTKPKSSLGPVSDVLQITIDGENDVNLQDLRQEQMHKCSEHADSIGLECVLVSIKATVVWYLIKKDERMTLTLHDFWEGVASNVRQKYSAGKKDVGINLELIFGRDKTGIAPSALVAELPAAKISLTQTAKLKKEADERDRLRAGIVEQTKVLQMSRICK